VGYLDESLGTCWEDFDMCLRVADAGYRIMTIGSARVVHLHGKTTGRNSPYIVYYLTRNRLICLCRYNSWGRVLRCAPQLVRSLAWQVRGYGGDLGCHRAFVLGIADFALGRRGERPHTRGLRRSDRRARHSRS
jgi:GT2 family glycosyltransferase